MKRFGFLALAALMALTGCSGTQERLGLVRRAPDEFAVVKRAPLQMPPDYGLRPPRPGAPRPQEQSSADAARAAVLGNAKTPSEVSRAESDLIRATGGAQAPANIRTVVDTDSDDSASEPVVKKILGIGGGNSPQGKAIDPVAESQRLKRRSTAPVAP